MFCTFLYSRVSTSDPSDRPCVPQRATLCPPVCQQFRTSCETAKSGLFFLTVEKGLIDLFQVMTNFYRPRPSSELPNLQHLKTTESARISNEVQVPKKNPNCPRCGPTQLGKRLGGSLMNRSTRRCSNVGSSRARCRQDLKRLGNG